MLEREGNSKAVNSRRAFSYLFSITPTKFNLEIISFSSDDTIIMYIIDWHGTHSFLSVVDLFLNWYCCCYRYIRTHCSTRERKKEIIDKIV